MTPLHVPTRPELKSFWFALSSCLALLVAAALWAFRVPYAAAAGVAIFSGSFVLGIRSPALAMRPQAAWSRLSRKARQAARLWLSGVAFLMLWIVGLPGARLSMHQPVLGGSGWIDRASSSKAERAERPLIGRDERATAWFRRLAAWAWRSGNAWTWCLVPILALLKAVEGETQGSLGGNVYTLY